MDVSSLLLADTPEGCRLKLRVRAGARRDQIVGALGGALKVSVSAPPERGRANQAVLELLAKAAGIPPARLRLIAGAAYPDKSVLIEGLSSEDLRRRLAAER